MWFTPLSPAAHYSLIHDCTLSTIGHNSKSTAYLAQDVLSGQFLSPLVQWTMTLLICGKYDEIFLISNKKRTLNERDGTNKHRFYINKPE